MGIKENLLRSIKYEEALARKYEAYSREAGQSAAAQLFMKMAKDQWNHVSQLKRELTNHCKS